MRLPTLARWIVLGTAIVLSAALMATTSVHADDSVRATGDGHIRFTDRDGTTDGDGEWTWHEGRMLAWRLVHADGARTYCADGHGIHHTDDATYEGRCGGSRAASGTDTEAADLTLWFDADGTGPAFDATMTPDDPPTTPPADDAPPATRPLASLLGVLFTALTFLFLATTLVLGWFYVQERRFRDYLVRRLFEETKGRLPAHWPEGRSKTHIARLIARGKN